MNAGKESWNSVSRPAFEVITAPKMGVYYITKLASSYLFTNKTVAIINVLNDAINYLILRSIII